MTPDRTPQPAGLPTQHETDPVLVGLAEGMTLLYGALTWLWALRLWGVL